MKKLLFVLITILAFSAGACAKANSVMNRELFAIKVGSGRGLIGVKVWGGERPSEGPQAIAANSREIYIADQVNGRINVYDYFGHLLRDIKMNNVVRHMAATERGEVYILCTDEWIYRYTRSKGVERYIKSPIRLAQYIHVDTNGRLALNSDFGGNSVIEPNGSVTKYPDACVFLGPNGSVFQWMDSELQQTRGTEVLQDLYLEDNRFMIPIGTDAKGNFFVLLLKEGGRYISNPLNAADSPLRVDFSTPFNIDYSICKTFFYVRPDGVIVFMVPDFKTCPVFLVPPQP